VTLQAIDPQIRNNVLARAQLSGRRLHLSASTIELGLSCARSANRYISTWSMSPQQVTSDTSTACADLALSDV
jgi:hypothetical protein